MRVFRLGRSRPQQRFARQRVVFKNDDLIEVVCEHAGCRHSGHSRTNNNSLPAKM